MPLISNSTVKLVKVTSLLDRPITGTAEYVIYCVDNGVDPKTFWIWRNSAWEEIYTTITDQYIITRQLTGLTITGGTVTSTDTILSAFGKLQNQLNSVASPMVYQGTWNANTNSPTLTSSTGTKGHVYRVTTSGATNIDGTTDWKSGDFIVFNGTTWDKWDSTDAVTSVNGYVGNVVLVKSDVGLGNVPNVDATNPANIVQNTNYRFVTDTEKTYWNGKQDALGYVPEDVANKATTMTGNTTSNVKYLTSKAVYDWGTSTFIPLNAPILGATKTKITYDSKGLVTAGADATTADIADSLNKRYVTDANLIVIGNTSNTNTGDETQSSIKTKLGEASATQDGYLSAFYWSAFNNKQSAISLTNIGNSGAASFISNTLNIPVYTISGLGGVSTSRNINTTAPLQGGGDLSTDRTLSITQATIGSSGYLSSTDWNKFNDKQNALSGGITNRVTKWTSSTDLGNSIIFDDGTNVGVGITTPTAKLHISNPASGVNSLLVEDNVNPDATPFVINNGGNVGIGLLVPTAKLHITNIASIDSFLVDDSANPDSTPFIIDNNGNVGVGTTTPSTSGKLVVVGNGATGLVLDPDSATTTNSTRLILKSSTASKDISIFNVAGALRFSFSGTANSTGGNSKYIMTESGSMLINATSPTTSPVSALTTYATGVASTAEEIARFGVYSVSSPGTPIGATLALRNGTTTDNEFLPQLRGGQATTSTLSALQIDALLPTVQDTTGNSNPALIIRTGNSSGTTLNNRPLFDLRNGSTSALFVDANNQIGINTTVPQYTLDVSGSGIKSHYTGSPSNAVAMSGDILTENTLLSTHDLSYPVDFVINATSDQSTNTLTPTYLRIKTFGQDAVVIDNAQKVGFGTAAPSVKVHINSTTSGAFRLVDTTQGVGKYLKSDTNGVGTWSNLSVADTGLTITTTGTSGPATLVGNTLNIPEYSGGVGTQTLAQTLTNGNTTGANDILLSYASLNYTQSIKAAGNTINSYISFEDLGGSVFIPSLRTANGTAFNKVSVENSQVLSRAFDGTADATFSLTPGTISSNITDGLGNYNSFITIDHYTSSIGSKYFMPNPGFDPYEYTGAVNTRSGSGSGNETWAELRSTNYGNTYSAYIRSTNLGGAYAANILQVIDASVDSKIEQNTNQILISSSNTSFLGAQYDQDWSANFTARTLVDKAYVDAQVSAVTVGTASSVSHTVKAGVALTKGQAVYVSSANGTNMIVSKADYSTEGTSSKTMGLIAQNLAINGIGQVITEGLLAGLDTSTAGSEGDPVWLGDDGNLLYGLANKPVAPNHMVFIGIVTRKNNINGEIFVKVQNGFELNEIHNVLIESSTLADGDALVYESATGLWKNKVATTSSFNYGIAYAVGTQNLIY